MSAPAGEHGRTGTSLRQLARLIGVDEKAVRKAHAAGVFSERSVTRETGAPVVVDVQLAVQEWERSGRRLRGTAGRPAAAVAARHAPAGRQARTDAAEADEDLLPPLPSAPENGDDENPSPSLVAAQTTAMLERARKLRLENDVREGQLVEGTTAAKQAFEFARALRENILNVPARLAAELAAESDAQRVFARLDTELRAALASTAATLEAADNTEPEGRVA